jgi:hypothetical protein
MDSKRQIPTDALPVVYDSIELVRSVIGDDTEGVYALRIKGNDFMDALLKDDDVVILRRVPPAIVENGNQVMVSVAGRTMVKHIVRNGTRAELRSVNPNLPTLDLPVAKVEIMGKVIAVIRKEPLPPQMGDKPEGRKQKAEGSKPTGQGQGWQRGSQPQGTQRILEDHATNATGKSAERVESRTERSEQARGIG